METSGVALKIGCDTNPVPLPIPVGLIEKILHISFKFSTAIITPKKIWIPSFYICLASQARELFIMSAM